MLVTSALMIAVYAVVGGNEAGWTSTRTLGLLASAAVLFVAFVLRETKAAAPLVPLRLFKLRNVSVSQVVGVLWAAAMFAWFFLAALYLQQVLGYSALEVGLAFVPTSLVMMICSLKLSDRLVMALRHPPAADRRPGAGRRLARRCSPWRRSTAASSPTCCPR